MQISRLTLAYFSPTLSTKRILMNIVRGMGMKTTPTRELNLTSVAARESEAQFYPNDLLLLGVPTYGGRLPQVEPELLSRFDGRRTPAVLMVSYGSRDYGDTLLELRDLVQQRGFVPIGAACFVAEHSRARGVGLGRPDKEDVQRAEEFGQSLKKRIEVIKEDRLEDFFVSSVPGHNPYRPPLEIKGMAPSTNERCIYCMQCYRWCPTNAIPYSNPNATDASRCIACGGCVKRCPMGAREWDIQARKKVQELGEATDSIRREPEFFW